MTINAKDAVAGAFFMAVGAYALFGALTGLSVGTALHLTERGMHRIGRCAASPCENVIVDVTRNGRQRYCSVRCANRDAVRRHRSRGA